MDLNLAMENVGLDRKMCLRPRCHPEAGVHVVVPDGMYEAVLIVACGDCGQEVIRFRVSAPAVPDREARWTAE